ncbi:unnamed protein product [Closterium sp. Naga37s-1]|nr:unnamed protein product [Closterium sp. Naga37s-1]
MHGAAVARIDSFCISLPLSTSLPVRRYAAPPLRATKSAAIAAVEGAGNAVKLAASLPPFPSPFPASSPSSSADASASSASSAAPASPPPQSKRQYAIGALQQLPAVSPAAEIIGTALRRAKHVRASRGIMNAAKRERSKGAQQLDCLTKEISGPLGRYVRLFPRRPQLHPFESCLVELTLGDGVYEEVLSRVDALRKRVLDVGKNAASLVNKTSTVKEAEQATAQGMAQVEELYTRNSHVVERLKEITKRLRAIPVVRPDLPTLCLVGAPNVGKSSLVRAISSGKPEVCNYPFTTRGISMGHFYVDGNKHQVTDTPGLLSRPDEQRNSIELLTIAAITHLPTAVLFVHDPSEECGVNRLKQYQLYSEIKTRFADRVWIDVISKCDLPAAAPTEEPPGGQSEEADGDGRSAGLADLLPEGASEDGRREGEEGMGSGGEASDITEGRHTGGSNSSDSDRRDTAAVLLGEAEAVREAHGEEKAEVAVTAASVAAWEEYKAHGGPAAALRVSTVAGVGLALPLLPLLLHPLHFFASLSSRLPPHHASPLITPPPSSRLPPHHASPLITPPPSSRLPPHHASPLITPPPSSRLPPHHASPLITPPPSSRLPPHHASPLITPPPSSRLPPHHAFPLITPSPSSHLPPLHTFPLFTPSPSSHLPPLHAFLLIPCVSSQHASPPMHPHPPLCQLRRGSTLLPLSCCLLNILHLLPPCTLTQPCASW